MVETCYTELSIISPEGFPMYKICKTEQSAARQKELEQYLLKEMLQRHFDDISISDLCDGLNIPRKAFYRYFSGKRGALDALIDHTLFEFDSLTLKMGQRKDITQRNYLEFYFRFWHNQKDLLDAIDHSNLWEVLMDRSVNYAQEELNRTKKHLPSYQQEEGAYLTKFTVYGMMGIIQLWYRNGFAHSPETLAGITFRSLSQSLTYWNA